MRELDGLITIFCTNQASLPFKTLTLLCKIGSLWIHSEPIFIIWTIYFKDWEIAYVKSWVNNHNSEQYLFG